MKILRFKIMIKDYKKKKKKKRLGIKQMPYNKKKRYYSVSIGLTSKLEEIEDETSKFL